MIGLMNAKRGVNGSNNNTGGYPAMTMPTFLENTVFKHLPLHWQSAIQLVTVLSSAGATSDTIVSCNAHLFLFSQAEVGFNTGDVPYKNEVDASAARRTFSIFTSNNSRIKKTYNGTGSADGWWLRSPMASSSTLFCYVNYGGSANSNSASNSYGVSWGFCLGSKIAA